MFPFELIQNEEFKCINGTAHIKKKVSTLYPSAKIKTRELKMLWKWYGLLLFELQTHTLAKICVTRMKFEYLYEFYLILVPFRQPCYKAASWKWSTHRHDNRCYSCKHMCFIWSGRMIKIMVWASSKFLFCLQAMRPVWKIPLTQENYYILCKTHCWWLRQNFHFHSSPSRCRCVYAYG